MAREERGERIAAARQYLSTSGHCNVALPDDPLPDLCRYFGIAQKVKSSDKRWRKRTNIQLREELSRVLDVGAVQPDVTEDGHRNDMLPDLCRYFGSAVKTTSPERIAAARQYLSKSGHRNDALPDFCLDFGIAQKVKSPDGQWRKRTKNQLREELNRVCGRAKALSDHCAHAGAEAKETEDHPED